MTVQDVDNAFRKKAESNVKLYVIRKKIENGTATMEDMSEYSNILCKLLGKTLGENISGVPESERAKFCEWLLRNQYEDTNERLATVQRFLDKKQNIHIAAKKPKFPAERVRKAAHSLEDKTVSEEVIQRRAENAVANIANSFHDDYIKENAKFRQNAGLKCHVTRIGAFNCCAWCAEVAGRYEVGREPADFWRRHDSCSCRMDYENQKVRQRLSGQGKGWKVDSEVQRRQAQRIQYKPTRFTKEQAKALESKKLSRIKGLTSAGRSDMEYSLFRQIEYNETNPITAQRAIRFNLYQVTNSKNNIYVSEGARNDHVKPKELHKIDMHLSEVYKIMNIEKNENLPTVYVVNEAEMNSYAAASYNAILNVLYLSRKFAIYSGGNVPDGMEQFSCHKDDRSSYVHELYHWLDAEKFRQKYGQVTQENYGDYVDFINQEAKKKLDKLVKKGYNINDSSDYGKKEYQNQKYYETYTEYRVTNLLEE